MKWKQEYATGIEAVDKQHKTLFTAAEDFRAAMDEGLGERSFFVLLDFLTAYCKHHFRFEEQCMEKHRCPVAEKNKEAHTRFLAVVCEFEQRFEKSGYRAVDARELIDTVDRWLDDHICRIDVHLKKCVNKEGPSQDGSQ